MRLEGLRPQPGLHGSRRRATASVAWGWCERAPPHHEPPAPKPALHTDHEHGILVCVSLTRIPCSWRGFNDAVGLTPRGENETHRCHSGMRRRPAIADLRRQAPYSRRVWPLGHSRGSREASAPFFIFANAASCTRDSGCGFRARGVVAPGMTITNATAAARCLISAEPYGSR
jgi:hypothetical protein